MLISWQVSTFCRSGRARTEIEQQPVLRPPVGDQRLSPRGEEDAVGGSPRRSEAEWVAPSDRRYRAVCCGSGREPAVGGICAASTSCSSVRRRSPGRVSPGGWWVAPGQGLVPAAWSITGWLFEGWRLLRRQRPNSPSSDGWIAGLEPMLCGCGGRGHTLGIGTGYSRPHLVHRVSVWSLGICSGGAQSAGLEKCCPCGETGLGKCCREPGLGKCCRCGKTGLGKCCPFGARGTRDAVAIPRAGS